MHDWVTHLLYWLSLISSDLVSTHWYTVTKPLLCVTSRFTMLLHTSAHIQMEWFFGRWTVMIVKSEQCEVWACGVTISNVRWCMHEWSEIIYRIVSKPHSKPHTTGLIVVQYYNKLWQYCVTVVKHMNGF